MTPSELVSLGRAIEEQERPKAAERKHEGQKVGGATRPGELGRCAPPKLPPSSDGGRTDEIVGSGLGMSGTIYRKAKRVVEAAETGDTEAIAAVERMDRNGAITPAYNAAGQRGSGHRSSPVPAVTAALSAPHWAPWAGHRPGEGARNLWGDTAGDPALARLLHTPFSTRRSVLTVPPFCGTARGGRCGTGRGHPGWRPKKTEDSGVSSGGVTAPGSRPGAGSHGSRRRCCRGSRCSRLRVPAGVGAGCHGCW